MLPEQRHQVGICIYIQYTRNQKLEAKKQKNDTFYAIHCSTPDICLTTRDTIIIHAFHRERSQNIATRWGYAYTYNTLGTKSLKQKKQKNDAIYIYIYL